MSFLRVSTQNPLGNRPLNLMSRNQGMGWFGAAPTPGDYDNNEQVLGELVAMGAITQQNATDIFNGDASLDDMAVNMTMINQALQMTGQAGAATPAALPPASTAHLPAGGGVQIVPYVTSPTPATPTPPIIASTSIASAQVPSGSTLLYTATVVGGPGDLTLSPDSAMSQFAAQLSAHGMTVTGSVNDESVLNKLFGTGAPINFQFQIRDNVGHALFSDAKSVCDGVLRQVVGNNVTTSNLSITSTPTAPGVTTAGGPGVVSFLENNAGMLALVVLGIFVLPPLIKKL